MQELGVDYIPMAGLAKENEELYIPGSSDAILLPKSSHGLHLLQHLRDEAHRFAVGYHRKLHKRKTMKSSLDDIPGIGRKRKSALLRQFGSVRGLKQASVEEIAAADGMNAALAKKVMESL
jgi:excinuclease ABC subunit C